MTTPVNPPAYLSGVIPVVSVPADTDLESLVKALADGGAPCIEMTLRREDALVSLETACSSSPIPVGAGTVTTVPTLTEALARGAHFAVSPCLDLELISYARSAGIPYLPGIATPTEAHRALAAGITMVKVFPAASLGGTAFLASLHAVFPNLTMMPTGGVSSSNLSEYAAVGSVVAIGGSWVVPSAYVAGKNWSGIASLMSQAIALFTEIKEQEASR